MKKLFLFIILFLATSGVSFAASPSPSSTTKSEDFINQIDQLKDKVASRVAQLKLVEKRGIIGTVTEVSDTQITLEDVAGNTRFVDVDELTKFNSEDKASFGISDVKKGMKLGVLGLYNKESRRLLARFIDVMTLPEILNGAVIATDEENFTITLATEDEKQYTVDIENVTKTYEYSSDGTLIKGGFTKIKLDQNAIVIGFASSKDPMLITGSRIVVFPSVPKNPKIIAVPSPSPSASASATKKPTPTP